MTLTETLQVMAILKAAYPNFYKQQSSAELQQAAKLWAYMFADDDGKVIAAAVKGFIATDTKGFPPVIGQIKQIAYDLTHKQEMTEQEAWNLVCKAIKNSIYNYADEFTKLPPVIQDVVGSPNQLREWAMVDVDDVQTVIASNFQRSYRVRSKNFRHYDALPPDVKEIAKALGTRLDLSRALEKGD